MCNCAYHFDVTAECTCQCDHEVEYVIERIIERAYNFLVSLDPTVVKALAKHLDDYIENKGESCVSE